MGELVTIAFCAAQLSLAEPKTVNCAHCPQDVVVYGLTQYAPPVERHLLFDRCLRHEKRPTLSFLVRTKKSFSGFLEALFSDTLRRNEIPNYGSPEALFPDTLRPNADFCSAWTLCVLRRDFQFPSSNIFFKDLLSVPL